MLKDLRSGAITGAPLAEAFATGKEKLIPIMLSHGFGCTHDDYQYVCIELAKNGHIVFAIGHLDGSSPHLELENGTIVKLGTWDRPHAHPSIVNEIDPCTGQLCGKVWWDGTQ
jgi:predicted dienelactone hydrolase